MSQAPPTRRRWFQFLVGTLATLVALPGGGRASAVEITVETISDTWRKWQDHVITAKFVWAQRTTVAKEAFALRNDAGEDLPIKLPLRETTLGGFCTLVLDGDKWRYESESPIVNSTRDGFIVQKQTTVSKGGIAKVYMAPGAYDYPLGNITETKPTDVPRVSISRPPFLIFRSLSNGFFNPGDYIVKSDAEGLAKSRLVVLHERQQSPRWSLCADPDRDCVITHYALSVASKELVTADLTYIQSAEHGWVPKAWRIVELDRQGRMCQTTTAVVKEWQINTPIAAEEFELTFPVGTVVRDFRKAADDGETFSYEVLEDGQTRVVKPGER